MCEDGNRPIATIAAGEPVVPPPPGSPAAPTRGPHATNSSDHGGWLLAGWARGARRLPDRADRAGEHARRTHARVVASWLMSGWLTAPPSRAARRPTAVRRAIR